MEKAKTNILEAFYEHVDENDWLDGLDLYQAGKVGKIKEYEGGLVTATVSSFASSDTEVRLKIHPNGNCIQWLECTCRKNRATGAYCDHLAAFMIHLDRERSKLLAGLDSKMPLKPPSSIKKRIPKEEKRPPTNPEDKEGAAQAILTHLQGSIQSVSLIANGPMLRVRIEIKSGQITHYDLDLDNSARFLENHPDLKVATQEIRDLTVFPDQARRGTRIYQPEDEKIVVERVVAIPISKTNPKKADKEAAGDTGIYVHVPRNQPAQAPQTVEFYNIKDAQRYVGTEFFFVPGRGYYPLTAANHHDDWTEIPLKKAYKEDQAAKLVQGGFSDYTQLSDVWLSEELSDAIIEDAPNLAEIKVIRSDDGWFYLDPTYGGGKNAVSMVDLILQFKKKKRSYIKSGKSWLKIPDLVREHEWLIEEDGKAIKVDLIGLMRIKAAVGDLDHFAGSKHIINQLRNKTEFTPVGQHPDLSHTKLNLRSYQKTGLEWLWWLYKNRLHGLLADEMGLGKTHQAMALLSAIQTDNKKAKFLVVAPTTVLDHWLDKAQQYCPNLRPLKHHGPKRFYDLNVFEKNHNLLITSYGVLLRDIKTLAKSEWDALILDEAHFVKNNDTATYRSVCKVPSRVRICLTGTPMENHLGELKSIFDFLVPGFLGSDEFFKKNFITPITTGAAPETELALQKLIYPFKMRRIKDNVLEDLPPKIEDFRHCTLSDEQVRLYKDILALKAAPLVEQLKQSSSPIPYLHVFATLTLLKQICNHPALVLDGSDYRKHHSGKFELFKELLEEALGSGHKIVIYSQYVAMIRILESYLQEHHIGHVCLTGQTKNRGKVIATFQEDPNCKVFVGSLLAGGIGIDLTAASVVIHYDRWWNASKENQATDRVHRIGQQRNVQVLKLITRGTLEEKIDELIKSKSQLFEKFMDQDEELFKKLDRQQLIELLQ